jgi:hypothetical protein
MDDLTWLDPVDHFRPHSYSSRKNLAPHCSDKH